MEFDLIRILFAFICGHALCLSGTLTQVVTSNPLSSPSTLGFDGVVVFIYLLVHFFTTFIYASNLGLTTFVVFSILFLLLVFIVRLGSKSIKEFNMNQVILMGLGFNLLIGAIFSIVQFLFMAMNFQFPSGLWFGNFKASDFELIYILIPILFIGIYQGIKLEKSLVLINIDKSLARSCAVDVSGIQKKSLLLSLFLTGSTICFFGVFSFLGLIFPHIMRTFGMFKGSIRNEILIAPFIAGGLLAVLDFVCYNITFYGAELPVGMVSSVLGSLLLVIIVVKKVVS